MNKDNLIVGDVKVFFSIYRNINTPPTWIDRRGMILITGPLLEESWHRLTVLWSWAISPPAQSIMIQTPGTPGSRESGTGRTTRSSK